MNVGYDRSRREGDDTIIRHRERRAVRGHRDVVAQEDSSAGIDALYENARMRVRTCDGDVANQYRFRWLQILTISVLANADACRAPVVHDVAGDDRRRAAFEPRIAFAVVGVETAGDGDVADSIVDERSFRVLSFWMCRVRQS